MFNIFKIFQLFKSCTYLLKVAVQEATQQKNYNNLEIMSTKFSITLSGVNLTELFVLCRAQRDACSSDLTRNPPFNFTNICNSHFFGLKCIPHFQKLCGICQMTPANRDILFLVCINSGSNVDEIDPRESNNWSPGQPKTK